MEKQITVTCKKYKDHIEQQTNMLEMILIEIDKIEIHDNKDQILELLDVCDEMLKNTKIDEYINKARELHRRIMLVKKK